MKAPISFSYLLPVFYAILACFLWGSIFLVSLCLTSFHCIDVVLGRYICFGMVSCLILFWRLEGRHERSIFQYWKQAGMNALVMNFVYYTSFTLALRWANPAEVAILIGLSPITIAIGDMALNGRMSFKGLAGPLICISLGIVLMNLNALTANSTNELQAQYFYGLLLGVLSLLAWTWYVIYNTRFLQRNPHVDPKRWTLLVGVMTLMIASLGMSVRWMMADEDYFSQFSLAETSGQSFLIGIVTLGVICSWIAYTLWNLASAKLPSVVSGQIAVLEMVFSLLFVYLYRQVWPTVEEFIGVGFILIGIWMGLLYFYGDKGEAQIGV